MAPPSPFTTTSLFMTATVSRQFLGPRVPVTLKAIKRPAKPANGIVTPVTATATPIAPVIAAQHSRGLASGRTGDMGPGTCVTFGHESGSPSSLCLECTSVTDELADLTMAEKTHVTDKKPSDSKYDVQSSASGTGFADRSTAHGQDETATGHARSQAAMQKDETKAGDKMKSEFKAAPEPIIGANDERGGKGR
ncbi:MAG: hypothetical protein Q9159_002081 [Coniocarpon cinnabarinum]